MGEPTMVWDGFRWVEVEAVQQSNVPRLLQSKQSETTEAQQRLVKVQREIALQRAQRARTEFKELKQEQAQEVRRTMDELVGKDAIRELVKIKPAVEEEVQEWAWHLTLALLKEYNWDLAQKGRAWIRLWRETDKDGIGRITFSSFVSMMRQKLPLARKSRRGREEVSDKLRALWRAIDRTTDGAGDLKGYVVLSEFIAFLKCGAPGEFDEEVTAEEARIGAWRERVAAQRKADARELREQRRRLREADELTGDLDHWRQEMADVLPASQAQLRDISVKLNERLGNEEGWYSLYKRMDRSGDGKVSWSEFSKEVRDRLPAEENSTLRRIWRALDPSLAGFLSLSEFRAWMNLGPQLRRQPPSLQQLTIRRARIDAEREESEARAIRKRSQLDKRALLTEEADRLERVLQRMKNEDKDKQERSRGAILPQIGGAQTERSRRQDYRKILYREVDEEKKYLGNSDALEHRRRMQNYRSISARMRN